MASPKRVRAGWLIAALLAAPLSAGFFFAFQTGSCQDSANPEASSCMQGPEPFGLLLGLAGVVFVAYALVRAFRAASRH